MTMCKADPFVKNSGTEGKCQRATSPQRRLSQAAGLAFGLEQAEDVVLTDCAQLVLLLAGGRRRGELRTSALDVADDGTGLVVHELDTALGDTTTGACNISVSLPFSQVTLHPPRFFDCALLLSLLLVGEFGNFAYRFGQGHG